MLNRAIVMGFLGADPELRSTQNGKSVCSIRIATSERWRDDSGEKHEVTTWHTVVCWEKTAENVAKYLHKGDLVHIEGKMATRKWTDKDGIDRWVTEIVCEKVTFIPTGKKEGQPSGQQGRDYGRQGGQQPRNSGGGNANVNASDDDIPF